MCKLGTKFVVLEISFVPTPVRLSAGGYTPKDVLVTLTKPLCLEPARESHEFGEERFVTIVAHAHVHKMARPTVAYYSSNLCIECIIYAYSEHAH